MRIPNPCRFCQRFFKEFKDFTLRGNVLDLAIGLIIGTAFTNLVTSFIEDIITPPLGLLLGGVDFRNLTIEMPNFVYTDKPPVVIRYGKFLQELIDLSLVAFVLFFLIKSINRIQKLSTQRRIEEKDQAKIELSDEGKILLQIRNILLAERQIVIIQEYVL